MVHRGVDHLPYAVKYLCETAGRGHPEHYYQDADDTALSFLIISSGDSCAHPGGLHGLSYGLNKD